MLPGRTTTSRKNTSGKSRAFLQSVVIFLFLLLLLQFLVSFPRVPSSSSSSSSSSHCLTFPLKHILYRNRVLSSSLVLFEQTRSTRRKVVPNVCGNKKRDKRAKETDSLSSSSSVVVGILLSSLFSSPSLLPSTKVVFGMCYSSPLLFSSLYNVLVTDTHNKSNVKRTVVTTGFKDSFPGNSNKSLSSAIR